MTIRYNLHNTWDMDTYALCKDTKCYMCLIQLKTEPSTHGEASLEVQTPKRSQMNEETIYLMNKEI